MNITIYTKNVLNEVRAKIRQEGVLAGADDMPYPDGLMKQHMNEANARLIGICNRFSTSTRQLSVDDTLGINEAYVYGFFDGDRRWRGKEQQLADIMHSYLVNLTLSLCYSSPSTQALAENYATLSAADSVSLSKLFFAKNPPRP